MTVRIIKELSTLERDFTKENFDKIVEIAWDLIRQYDEDADVGSLEELLNLRGKEGFDAALQEVLDEYER